MTVTEEAARCGMVHAAQMNIAITDRRFKIFLNSQADPRGLSCITDADLVGLDCISIAS